MANHFQLTNDRMCSKGLQQIPQSNFEFNGALTYKHECRCKYDMFSWGILPLKLLEPVL